MSEVNLREYLGWGETPMQVDREAAIIRGVKVLGLQSRNGRRYTEEALRRAVPLYEGAKVNVNHPPGPGTVPRDYRDRLGFLSDVEYRAGEGLFANLHFNPRHDVAERLIWDAQHAPQNVGLSHNVLARVRPEGELTVVYEIAQVLSVDLVADPASTQGLFEAQSSSAREISGPAELPPDRGAAPHVQEEVRLLRRELALRRALRDSLLAAPDEAGSGRVAIGPNLWRVLLREADPPQSRLLAELAEMVRTVRREGDRVTTRPTSRDALLPGGEPTAEEFARSITRPFAG